MTPNRVAAIVFRSLISAVFTLWLFAPNAQGQSAAISATSMTGVYNGTCTGKGGSLKLKVSLIGAPDDTLAGFFIVDLPNEGPRLTYKLTGRYAWGIHEYLLTSVPWGPAPPAGYSMGQLIGKYYPGSDLLQGRVISRFCSDFWGTRDKSESPESIAAALATPPAAVPESKPSTPRTPQSNAAVTSAAVATTPAPKSDAPPPKNIALNKKPCDFITKSDAESILGSPVDASRDSQYECRFVEAGFTSKAPKNKQVSLSVWYSATPNPSDYAERRKNIVDYKAASDVVKDVAGFADAAVWKLTPGWGGVLVAFKGGTIQVEVTISGIPDDAALQNAKTLAAKPLGGSDRSGYAYVGAPGSSAKVSVAAVQSPASYGAAWMGQSKVVRGTVSRMSVDFNGLPWWMTIFFKESPDAAFVVCTPYPDMFQETVGDLYTLVGKTLEVTGQVERSMCGGKGASIRVVDSEHYRVQATAADVAASRPARVSGLPRRQGARVGLDICNGGKAGLDAVVFVKQGGATSTHIAPRDCAHVYEESGEPAYVGFAFADSHGQWVGPHRLDLLPNYSGSDNARNNVWSKADQSVSVKHGTREVSLPLQLLFNPPGAACHTSVPYSAVANLPFNATDSERSAAHAQDASSPGPVTTCDSFDYTLNAVVYPDTREVTFEKKCFECPHPHDSAEQQAAKWKVIGTMARISPLAGGIMGQAAVQQEEQELKESLEGPPEYQRMNWNEMNVALAKVRPAGGRPPEMPPYLVIRGTVSRVDVSPPGASEHWINVYFRESAEERSNAFETFYGAFNTCTSSSEIFEDMFGPDFRSRMIGQVLEIEGEYQRYYCKGYKGSIRISLAHQVHKVAGINPVDTKKGQPGR